MMRQLLVFLNLIAVGTCLGQSAGTNPAVTGTLTYLQRMALPPDAMVQVRLEDASAQDTPAKMVAESNFLLAGKQVPIPFELKYDPSQIKLSHRYIVRASITGNSQLMFTTTTSYPVITEGAPMKVDLVLEQVSQPAGTSSTQARVVPLEWTYWKLVEIAGRPAVPATAPTEAHLILHPNEKRIAGSSGCNRIVGGYTVDGDSLKFTPAGMTMMACSHALMQQEQDFSRALKETTGYRVHGEILELLGNNHVLAIFYAQYLK